MNKRTVSAIKGMCLLVGVSMFALPVSAADDIEYRYACQVLTVNGVQGYVVVQAKTKEQALVMAARSQRAQTFGDTWEATQEVVECIDSNGGTFSDKEFQSRVELLPR